MTCQITFIQIYDEILCDTYYNMTEPDTQRPFNTCKHQRFSLTSNTRSPLITH